MMLRKNKFLALSCLFLIASSLSASLWDLNWSKIISGASKVYQAYTLSDADMVGYVKEYVEYSDKQNRLAPASSPYHKRLQQLVSGIKDVDGTPLNFRVYITDEVNAFACADGSVRVYSGLMDLMTDDEVLGVIGHEIGHVAHKDSKNAAKQALINSAIIDGLGSMGSKAKALSESQLASLGESLLSSKYSRKQETSADDYGYDFLVKKGRNPWSMAMAFDKLQKLESGSASKLSSMFSSHPDTSSRIKHIVDRCKADGIAAPEGCTLGK